MPWLTLSYTLKCTYLDQGFIRNYHTLKFNKQKTPYTDGHSISRKIITNIWKNRPLNRKAKNGFGCGRGHGTDLAHTDMTATAATTKLCNATLNGKHATPPLTGTPEHLESAGVSTKLDRKLLKKGGGAKLRAGKCEHGKEPYLQSAALR